jgi:hypothetical protein
MTSIELCLVLSCLVARACVCVSLNMERVVIVSNTELGLKSCH